MVVSPNQYYKILGLQPDATIEQLKKAYRNKARLYHPDLNSRKDAAEIFIAINEAYEYLEDYIGRKNGKDESREKLIREWEEYRRAEARKRAYRHAKAKYSEFKKSKNYRASMVLNKAQLYINLSVAIFIISMAVIAYIIKWKMVDEGYDPPTLASFLFLLSIGLLFLLVSLAHLQEFYRKNRKIKNNEKKD